MRKFKRFIYESKFDSFSNIIADEILRLVKESSANKRTITRDLNYDDPVSFFLTLHISRSTTFSPAKSKAFKQLPWETINFERRGFVIDANSYVPSGDEEPEVEMSIIISPEAEPNCYQALYFKVLDIIRHEMEHLLQKGANQQDGHIVTTRQKTRSAAEESYRYFLLADEIPSMVSGMHLAAVKKRIPIDVEFEDYLFPFIESGFITREEADKVIKVWLDFAVQHFPTVKVSNNFKFLKPGETR
jgi:hypothetical protein